MLTRYKPSSKLIRYASASFIMVAMAVLAFASKGGGGKKNDRSFRNNFTPISSSSAFTLRKMPVYSGSISMIQERTSNRISIHSMITYQRGNTTFILPYRYKVTISAFDDAPKTNLQFLGVKIKMPK